MAANGNGPRHHHRRATLRPAPSSSNSRSHRRATAPSPPSPELYSHAPSHRARRPQRDGEWLGTRHVALIESWLTRLGLTYVLAQRPDLSDERLEARDEDGNGARAGTEWSRAGARVRWARDVAGVDYDCYVGEDRGGLGDWEEGTGESSDGCDDNGDGGAEEGEEEGEEEEEEEEGGRGRGSINGRLESIEACDDEYVDPCNHGNDGLANDERTNGDDNNDDGSGSGSSSSPSRSPSRNAGRNADGRMTTRLQARLATSPHGDAANTPHSPACVTAQRCRLWDEYAARVHEPERLHEARYACRCGGVERRYRAGAVEEAGADGQDEVLQGEGEVVDVRWRRVG